MSKSVRLKEHLVIEVERLATEERRSLAQMVELLLEQALRGETEPAESTAVKIRASKALVTEREPSPPPGSRSVSTPDEARKQKASSDGCDAYAPARTKCKVCGKVHPL